MVKYLCGGVFDILSITVRKPEFAITKRDPGLSYSNLIFPGFFNQILPFDTLPSELVCSKMDFNEKIELK